MNAQPPQDVAPLTSGVPVANTGLRQLARRLRSVFRWIFWPGVVLCLLAGLWLHYALPSWVEAHRGELVATLARHLDRPLTVQDMTLSWQDLSPQFNLRAVQLFDQQGRVALDLPQAQLRLAWASLWRGQPIFSRMDIQAQTLDAWRDTQGRIYVAGLPLDLQASEPTGLRWLLEQPSVQVSATAVRWQDAWRNAPMLALDQVVLNVHAGAWGRHSLEFTAQTPAGLGEQVVVRGAWRGDIGDETDDWRGTLYLDVAHADTAALAPWLTLPATFPQGRGKARLWLEKSAQALVKLSADLDIQGVVLPWPGSNAPLRAAQLKGQLELAEIPWAKLRHATMPPQFSWRANLQIRDAEQAAWQHIPGFSRMQIAIVGSERAGRVHWEGKAAQVQLPAVFVQAEIPLDGLVADVRWQANADKSLGIYFDDVRFANKDAAGKLSGSYRYAANSGPGNIDITAQLHRARGDSVWRYIPRQVGAHLAPWLRHAIQSGVSDDVRLRLAGDLRHFPFRDGRDGTFLVDARVHNGTLRYAPDWPEIREIDGSLRVEGQRLVIRAEKGRILDAALGVTEAEIPDLETYDEVVKVSGTARGPTQTFLDFIEKSPVRERLHHATQSFLSTGDGALDLKLWLPLRRMAESEVAGDFRFNQNTLRIVPEAPTLAALGGTVHFSHNGIKADAISGNVLGGGFTADITTSEDGHVRIASRGRITAEGLQSSLNLAALDQLAGSAAWKGLVDIRQKDVLVTLDSPLVGLYSELPPPFAKLASEAHPLHVSLAPTQRGGEAWVTLGAMVRGHFAFSAGQALRGTVTLGEGDANLSGNAGVAIRVHLPQFNLDAYSTLLADATTSSQETSQDTGETASTPASGINHIDIQAGRLQLFGRYLHDFDLTALRYGNQWRGYVDSSEIKGKAQWNADALGRITGHFEQVRLPERNAENSAYVTANPDELPAIDVTIDDFSFANKKLGRVHLSGTHDASGVWVGRMIVDNPDGRLQTDSRWQATRQGPETQTTFQLHSNNLDQLLARLGYPGTLRRGTAQAEGTLSWRGTPLTPDEKTMNGHIKLLAENGQFNQLHPGAGRLLSVLSLQSLPRRLTLDFRDIFSEGFLFDRISGNVVLKQGVARSDDLQMVGPPAKVFIAGSASLVDETQDLKVRVQPALSETALTGAVLAHPVIGGVAWVFNQLFGKPLDSLFAFDYSIKGSWVEPVVRRENVSQPKAANAAAVNSSPTNPELPAEDGQ